MMKKGYFLLFLFFLTAFILFGEGEILLEWEEDSNSFFYTVELKKDNIPLFTKRVEEARLSLELSPGSYEYRVSFYNKFEKLAAQSEWAKLTIIKDIVPAIIRVQEKALYAYDRKQTVILEAVDTMEGAQITLQNKEGFSRELTYDVLGFDRYALHIDTKSLSQGYYDLILKNPSGSETWGENIIYLNEKKRPIVKNLIPQSALLDAQIPHVILEGKNFDSNIVVFLIDSRGKRIRIPINDIKETEALDLWFDLKGLKKGSYDMLLINPPYEETYWEDCFTIVDEKDIRDTDYYQNIRWGTDFLLGFPILDLIYDVPLTNIMIVEGKQSELLPELEFIFRLDFSDTTPLLKYFGLENRTAFLPTDKIYFTTLNLGIYGKTHMDGPLNFFINGDMGYRFMDVGNGEVSGYIFTGGGGIQLNYDQWLFEFSFRNDLWVIQTNTQINLQQYNFRMGYRF